MDISTGKLYDMRDGETREQAAERLNLKIQNLVEVYGEEETVRALSDARVRQVAEERAVRDRAARRAANKRARAARRRNR